VVVSPFAERVSVESSPVTVTFASGIAVAAALAKAAVNACGFSGSARDGPASSTIAAKTTTKHLNMAHPSA
jgi:hypothetical protein